MTLQKAGGVASLVCAATYIVGFALLLTLLAPSGYGTGDADAGRIVAFIVERPGLVTTWNTTIYVVNALALLVVVAALHERLASGSPGLAKVGGGIGLVWTALVLGAGMVANVGVEETVRLYGSDPDGAVALWRILHAVELGLGGGNEIAGAVWALLVGAAVWNTASLSRGLAFAGVVLGIVGLATVVPAIGDAAGAVFGLGFIVWFIWVGVELLLRDDRDRSTPRTGRPATAT